MALSQIVLDFDGTFTDLTIEAAPFPEAFRQAIGDLLGRDVGAEWDAAADRIRSKPSEFGWEFQGKIVAPSLADPYLLATAVVQEVLNRAAVLTLPDVRTTVTQALYGYAYRKTLTAFKPTAKACFEGLLALGVPCAIVTNSETKAVAEKIDKLAPAGRERLVVRGEARKFWITDAAAPFPDRVADVETSPSLPRPILIRRGKYLDVLRDLWKDGGKPEETLVVGDIYELDLALPAALGCTIALVDRGNTQDYERERVAHHGGHVLADVGDALPLARSLHARTR